jgi:hypothetical protein
MNKSIEDCMLLLEHRLDWILEELERLEKLLVELFNENNVNTVKNSVGVRMELLRSLLSDLNDAARDWEQIESKLREAIISQLKSTSQQPGAKPPPPISDIERALVLFAHFKRLQNRTQYLLLNVDVSLSIPIHNHLYINFLTSAPHEKPPAITGWFKKQGQQGFVKLWKRRFFTQKDTQLHYFTSECTHKTPKGTLNLNTLIHVRPVLKENITNTQNNELYLNTNITEQVTCSTLMMTTSTSWLEVSVVRLTQPLTIFMTTLLQIRAYLLDCSITNLSAPRPASKSHSERTLSGTATSTLQTSSCLYWLDLFMRWMRYIDTMEFHKYRDKYRLKMTSKISEVITPTKTEGEVAVAEPLDAQLQAVEQQLADSESAFRTLTLKVDALKRNLTAQERLRTLKLNEKIQTLQSTVAEQHKEIVELLSRLNDCHRALRMSDEKCKRTLLRVLAKKETLLIQREEAKQLSETVAAYQRQKETQEEYIATLHKEIEKLKHLLENKETQQPNIAYSSSAKENQLLSELNSLKKGNKQQQHENELLSHQIQHVEQRHRLRTRAREETCNALRREYDATHQIYKQTLAELLADEGVDDKLIEDLDDLKRTYFFTLAVGIKLQNQISDTAQCDVDLSTLYAEIEEQGIPRTQWTEWLTRRMTTTSSSSTPHLSSALTHPGIGSMTTLY